MFVILAEGAIEQSFLRGGRQGIGEEVVGKEPSWGKGAG
jgi:hypothetical protein